MRRPFALSLPNLLEELCQRAWVVAGIIKDLRPQNIGLALFGARVLQQNGIEREVRAELLDGAAHAAEKSARGRQRHIPPIRFRRAIGAVAQRHVGDLMRHHAREWTSESASSIVPR